MGTAEQKEGIPAASDSVWRDRLPVIVLGLGLVAAGALLFHLTRNLTFIGDDWDPLLRQGWGFDQLLLPHNEHPIVAVVFIYKVLQSLFGMDSARPAQLVLIASVLVMAVLFFVYVRRRVGGWAAVIMTFLVLFLGAGYEDFLWTFQITFVGSMAAGLGALIALDRDDRKGDVAAAALLVLSLTFSGGGIPFVVAAAAEWLLNPRDRKQRILVPAAPTVVFGLWWLGWGHEATSSKGGPTGILDVPRFVFNSISAGFNSITGLADRGSPIGRENVVWGKILFVIALGLGAWRMIKMPRIPRGLIVVIVLALSFFVLVALNQSIFRLPNSSRYQLPGAVFILLVIAWLLAGVRIKPVPLVIAGVLSALAIVSGVTYMREQVNDYRTPRSINQKAILGAIDVSGDSVDPDYEIRFMFKGTPWTDYRATVQKYGSPGFSEEELLGLYPTDRFTADKTMVGALGITLDSGGTPGAPRGTACQVIQPDTAEKAVPATTLRNRGDGEVVVSLSRFGDPPGVGIGTIPPRGSAHLDLPADPVARPWQLTVTGGPAQVCPTD